MLKSEKMKMAAQAVIECGDISTGNKLEILRELIDIMSTAEFVEQRDREAADNETD